MIKLQHKSIGNMCSNDGPSDFSTCAPFANEEPEAPLQNHAASSANKGISARVTRVAYCQDAACSFAGLSPHLSVEIDDVPLKSKSATAISYAWGEFDREKTSIGHMSDDASAHVQLELGKEWVIGDFIDRLAELSKDAPIWIDQICIPQKEEAIRQVLANIPSIFRTFDVAALMPGHPCKCLDDILENRLPLILAAEDKTVGEKSQALSMPTEYQCLSSLAPSSWFKRIWTRQEFMYSRQIRCVWASSQRAKCVSLNALERNDLEPYMALSFEQLKGDGFVEKSIPDQLQSLQVGWLEGASYDLAVYLRRRNQTDPIIASALRFYGGDTFRNGQATADTVKTRIGIFAIELRWIGTCSSGVVHRRATRSCDYVVSVWVDCPGYTVPQGYRMMDAPELLDNATTQLMHNHGLALLTNAPRGLFDSETSGSALFDAATYFSGAPVDHVAELYGHLSKERSSTFLVNQTGAVPILLSARHPVALSHYAEEYTTFRERFSGRKETTLISLFRNIFSFCSYTCAMKSLNHMENLFHLLSKECDRNEYEGKPSLEEVLRVGRAVILLEKLASRDGFAQQKFSEFSLGMGHLNTALSGEIFDDRWETVMYDFMAFSLGMSCEVCRAARVAMMVDPGDASVARQPRIGFFRSAVDLRKLGRRAITVCMDTTSERQDLTSGKMGEAAPLLEAYQVGELGSGDVPKYRVFGVWMPTAVTKSEEYGASLGSLEEGGADAFLI